jgi:hypothetical protein
MTTLLVCLLETAGFDCAITVISWRAKEYTHVFAEVFYKNNWLILDPTLKQNGFGKQDKKIKRFKRITKKDMAKLQVLSDSTENKGVAKRLIRNRNRCCAKDNNKNTNNININFGTNVEHSHNSNSRNGAGFERSVNTDFPKMSTVFPSKQTASLPIVRPNENNYATINNPVMPDYQAFSEVNKVVVPVNKKIIVNNKRPKFVPNSSKNYYPEFP